MVSVFTVARIFFYLFNLAQFGSASFFDFVLGFWFDCMTTAIVFLPLLIFEMLPQFWRTKKWHFKLLKVIFFLLLIPTLLINIADIEYFKFTSARSNFSTFKMLSYGSDFTSQIPSFIRDYWYLLILLVILLIISNWAYNKLVKKLKSESKWSTQVIMFVIISAAILSVGRGWGLRPISPIRASQYTADQNAPLVLNSAFTVLKSAGKKTLTAKTYYDSTSILNWFTPIKKYDVEPPKTQPNIVIIMLESFSVEYIAAINGDSIHYTPFLDSIISEGLVFNNCFANGKKSIDAVPSVISSIPKLMPAEFITSAYSTNQIESLPNALKRIGYSSSFFHGATNGSMNFDGFAAKIKFDHYNGRKEYNNDKHYDGTWGIYDHFFLPWSVTEMSQLKQPFLSTIFTLSSHPPYSIPEHLQKHFNGGPTKMHNAVQYSDFALREFFRAAKKTDWYNNTLFVITADHTPASSNPIYFNERGVMSIPLVFFHPTDIKFKGKADKIVGQIDIMPTLLEYAGYSKPFYSFGESVFSKKAGFTVTELSGKYLVYGEGYFMVFQNGKVTRMYQIDDKTLNHTLIKTKPELVKMLKNKLLAYIQTYHNGMINNNLIAK